MLKPPPGYRFRGFYPNSVEGKAGLVALFGGPQPGDTLSFFQGPSQGMAGMSETRPEGLQVLTGKKGAADVTLVGTVSQPVLQEIMATIGPAPAEGLMERGRGRGFRRSRTQERGP